MLRLIKISENGNQGWAREYRTEEGLLSDLNDLVCSECKEGTVFDDGTFWLPDTDSITDMLFTDCGLGYVLEED